MWKIIFQNLKEIEYEFDFENLEYDEKFEDYKYYEDNTEDRENGNYGSVLPLWRFSTPKS